MNRRTLLTNLIALVTGLLGWKTANGDSNEFFKDDVVLPLPIDPLVKVKHPPIPNGYTLHNLIGKTLYNKEGTKVEGYSFERTIRKIKGGIELQQSYIIKEGKVIEFKSYLRKYEIKETYATATCISFPPEY